MIFSKHYIRNACIIIISVLAIISIVESVFVFNASMQITVIVVSSTIGAGLIGLLVTWLIYKAIAPYLKNAGIIMTPVSELKPPVLEARNLEYELDSTDVLAFYRYHNVNSPEALRRLSLARRFFFIISAIAVLFAIIMVTAFDHQELTFAIILGVCAIWMFLVGIFFRILTRRYVIRVVERNYGRGPNKLTGKHSLAITPDAVIDVTDVGESTTNWNTVKSVISNDEYLFISVHPGNPLIVPRRAFSSDDAFLQFSNGAKAYHQAAIAQQQA